MSRKVINPPTLYDPPGYSHIIETTGSRTVTIAGQVAIDADGNLVGEGDFAAQVAKSFENLRAALEAVGATPADLVKTTSYVVGLSPERTAAMRSTRDEFYAGVAPPTSTLIGVTALALPQLLFEIDATAVLD